MNHFLSVWTSLTALHFFFLCIFVFISLSCLVYSIVKLSNNTMHLLDSLELFSFLFYCWCQYLWIFYFGVVDGSLYYRLPSSLQVFLSIYLSIYKDCYTSLLVQLKYNWFFFQLSLSTFHDQAFFSPRLYSIAGSYSVSLPVIFLSKVCLKFS